MDVLWSFVAPLPGFISIFFNLKLKYYSCAASPSPQPAKKFKFGLYSSQPAQETVLSCVHCDITLFASDLSHHLLPNTKHQQLDYETKINIIIFSFPNDKCC